MTSVVTVARREEIAAGVFLFELEHAPDQPGRPWSAGAHIDVALPSGQTRQYSLTGELDSTGYSIAVLHQQSGRGGSDELCTAVYVGNTLSVSEPRNRFELVPAVNYRFIAGGIGITPIRTMIAQLERQGHHRWSLIYGGRTRDSMAFAQELASYGDRVEIRPFDEAGNLDLTSLAQPEADTVVYCCGPDPLLEAVSTRMADWHDKLHLERFSPGDVIVEGPDLTFEVELAKRGQVVTVPPDRSILEVVLEVDPDHPYSCADGTCGTCEANVLAGEPDHRDWVLTEEEQAANDRMMICVGRSRSARLVLDI